MFVKFKTGKKLNGKTEKLILKGQRDDVRLNRKMERTADMENVLKINRPE